MKLMEMIEKAKMKVKAKYPYTTVGMPARTSRAGFRTRRSLSGAYSLRKMAVASPMPNSLITR